MTFKVGRAWLVAALVSFVGGGCAMQPAQPTGLDSVGQPTARVKVEWRVPLSSDRPWEINPREFGKPVLAPGGDLVVGASDGYVYRVRADTGELVWSKEIGGSIDAPVALVDGYVYAASSQGSLHKLSWERGEEIWRADGRSAFEAQPAVSDGLVAVTDSADVLYVFDAVSGELVWDYQRRQPDFFTIMGGGTPVFSGNRIFCGFADGHLVSLFSDSGEVEWTANLGDASQEFGDVDLAVIDDGELLYAVSYAGGIYAVEKSSGALMWHQDIESVADLIMQGPWLLGVSATGHVFALSKNDGEPVWRFRMPEGQSPVALSTTGPLLSVATASGPLYLVRTRDGRPVTRWNPSSGFQRAPVYDSVRGYTLSNRGYLYGYRLAY
ncbi:PQQ-binding-like beta-propeller repeat protein [Lujinxingia vulgaris]|uniref:PQQ-binding-like beta-propeller repeat protein n=1 Tax=Lujinxingia vulgaris TaxID=2600176 RepID=A0A5C6XCW2_9DELT|nr:PQQ-binding-like beta-propeller repeat protein [Lujinxingia vulgaris]TXD37601.1 PQQ-binding-like beta-propeller repeat protein [Lujinxingia vulgaris]